MTDPAGLWRSYDRGTLLEADVLADPLAQFGRWFEEAVAAAVPEPNAMTLATVSPAGDPSARVVLLKGVDDRGFSFYTNYGSRKGRELDATGRAALVFWWQGLERQVRVEGTVERVSAAESDAYFARRPRGSRLSAVASPQSAVVPDRAALDALAAEVAARYAGAEDVPRPDGWGGYRVVPHAVEFWQGRTSRLHDRLRYARTGDGWRIDRLAP